jgi:hypothetical protein
MWEPDDAAAVGTFREDDLPGHTVRNDLRQTINRQPPISNP